MSLLGVKRYLQNAAGKLTFKVLFRIAGHLTPRRVEKWGNVLGWVAWRFSRRYRTVATQNLTMAFGEEYPPQKIRQMVREVFVYFCRGTLQFFYLAIPGKDRIDEMIDMTGVEHLDEALEKGRGVVVVTAHFGNWELLARKTCRLGYPTTVIARDSDDPGMTGIANKIREGAGYRVLGRDKSIRGAIQCLKSNELLGILPDQNISSGGVFVDFFGRPAATATGPAAFALRTGAAVIPAFAPLGSDGKYHGTVYPPIQFEPTGDKEADELALTALIAKSIEAAIRQYPTQWLWLHNRWKRAHEVEGKQDA